jgi:hypothetical protein
MKTSRSDVSASRHGSRIHRQSATLTRQAHRREIEEPLDIAL